MPLKRGPFHYYLVGEKMDYIQVGKIINTHGIKGEIKIYPLTDDIHRFDGLKIAYLGDDKIKVEIERVKHHKDTILLKLREFNNINEILPYKGEYLYINEEDKVTLPEDHFFLFDIIGCTVFTKEGEKVGIISQVIQSASNDIYVVRDDKKNKEYLIPAVKEFFISVDIGDKRIVIDPIEGMIE